VKVVFDTNVLLSAVLTRGLCEALLDACLSGGDFTLALSEHILREFSREARTKFGAPEDKVNRAEEFLRTRSELVEPAKVPADACRDPDDLPVLGTAIAAEAACLVTGDADLLELARFGGVRILSPRDFYDRIR
jgi:putative PIN family toxin of toxin-antitoxin system